MSFDLASELVPDPGEIEKVKKDPGQLSLVNGQRKE